MPWHRGTRNYMRSYEAVEDWCMQVYRKLQAERDAEHSAATLYLIDLFTAAETVNPN